MCQFYHYFILNTPAYFTFRMGFTSQKTEMFHSNLYEVPRKANATNNPNPFIHNVEKWPNIL